MDLGVGMGGGMGGGYGGVGGVLLLTYCNVCVAAAPSDVQPPLLSVFSSRPPGCAGLGGWDEFFFGGGELGRRDGAERIRSHFQFLAAHLKKPSWGRLPEPIPPPLIHPITN